MASTESQQITERLQRLEAEIERLRNSADSRSEKLSALTTEFKVLRTELRPMLKMYSENQSSVRRLFWTAATAIVLALGSLGVISFIKSVGR